MKPQHFFDVLRYPPKCTTSEEVERKKDDVKDSAKFALLFGASTGLAIWLEAAMICVGSLAAITALLILCLRNEKIRLAFMETIPLSDDNNSPSSSSSNSTIHTPTTLNIFASTSSQATNEENGTSSPTRKKSNQRAYSAPPTPRHR